MSLVMGAHFGAEQSPAKVYSVSVADTAFVIDHSWPTKAKPGEFPRIEFFDTAQTDGDPTPVIAIDLPLALPIGVRETPPILRRWQSRRTMPPALRPSSHR